MFRCWNHVIIVNNHCFVQNLIAIKINFNWNTCKRGNYSIEYIFYKIYCDILTKKGKLSMVNGIQLQFQTCVEDFTLGFK